MEVGANKYNRNSSFSSRGVRRCNLYCWSNDRWIPRRNTVENVITYYPAIDTFKTLHEILESRRRGAAGTVVHNNKIYIVGVIQNGHIDGCVPWLDEYDPVTEDWTILPDAEFARDHA